LAGFYGLISQRNLIKKVYALAIMNLSALLLFIAGGGAIGSRAPLNPQNGAGPEMVDPIPQALMLTAIVVGVCVSALALALIYRLYGYHQTLDCEELRRRINHD
jgi:multicomponent Na+:H+ antiporter subunit C